MDEWLDKISARQWLDEGRCIEEMLKILGPMVDCAPQVEREAIASVERIRSAGPVLSVEAFLQEYSLSSREGVAIMCMAEALLRIPDAQTANALLESTFANAQWDRHLHAGGSFYLNASGWGLLLTGKMLTLDAQSLGEPAHMLRSLARRSTEPVIRQALKAAMHLIARQFVMGETIDESLHKAEKLMAQGYRFSYDMLGEGARSWQQADQYLESYLMAVQRVAAQVDAASALYDRPSVSIKLTALHPRYEWLNKRQVMAELLPRLGRIVEAADRAGIAIAIDAEEATRLDLELEVFTALRLDARFRDYAGIGFVLQAYQKRAWAVIDYLLELSRRCGQRIPVRLVKGAYWDSEIKFAQMQGLSHYPVFTSKHHSDVSYLACAQRMLDAPDAIYPQFATHNAHTIAAIQQMGRGRHYEFQRLYGMGEALYQSVVGRVPCRIYAPVGEHRDLLAYLIRRLLENGANSSFVHRAMDKDIPPADVVQDPLIAVRQGVQMLPLPEQLFAARRNSQGVDFGNRVQVAQLLAGIHNTNTDEPVAPVDVDKVAATALQAWEAWAVRPVGERSAIILQCADRLHEQRDELVALLMREARKTLKDAVAEWREAIDFCRYYAQQAEQQLQPQLLESYTGEQNQLSFHPRGVFVCISPWNFPLAIFTGQVVAALITGNAVLAKPAEQTPLIAACAVKLMHQAGVPRDVLHLVVGAGDVGAALVRHPQIAGVCFTGSHPVAKDIQRALAARDGAIVPFIAETGGLNAMIADNSALPEQLCDDVVQSAFGSAGQRCSALRLLFLPCAIAEPVLELLKGAVEALHVGDPADPQTDVGPVIDAEAKARLGAHLAYLSGCATLRAITPVDDGQGDYVAPQIWELPDASLLKDEAFGPILHVVRYEADKMDDAIRRINQSGFGLTFGLHTRIQSRYASLAERVHAGNLYINRNMIGAVVGVQPFGGEGLSGTGPKAGGPHYLQAFITERTTSINVAAIGGNIDLLMKS